GTGRARGPRRSGWSLCPDRDVDRERLRARGPAGHGELVRSRGKARGKGGLDLRRGPAQNRLKILTPQSDPTLPVAELLSLAEDRGGAARDEHDLGARDDELRGGGFLAGDGRNGESEGDQNEGGERGSGAEVLQSAASFGSQPTSKPRHEPV